MTRTITLTPNGTVSSDWTRTGGTTQHGVVTDGSDATYIQETVGIVIFDLTAPALSGVVAAARVGFTHELVTTSFGPAYSATLVTAGGAQIADFGDGPFDVPLPKTSEELAGVFDPPYAVLAQMTGFLSQTVVDSMRLRLESNGGTNAAWRIYNCYVELDIEDNPPGMVPVGF